MSARTPAATVTKMRTLAADAMKTTTMRTMVAAVMRTTTIGTNNNAYYV